MKIQDTKEDFSKPIELTGSTKITENSPIPHSSNTTETLEIIPMVMEYVYKIMSNWKWIIISVVLTLTIAFVYLRYRTTTIFIANSSIILNDGKNKGSASSQINIINGLSVIDISNIENEIAILKSTKIIKGVVNELDLHTSYIIKGRVLSLDLYTDSPLKVDMAQEDLNKIGNPIELSAVINADKSVSITKTANDKTTTVKLLKLPALYTSDYGNILVEFRNEFSWNYRDPIIIVIRNPMSVIYQFRNTLNITPFSEESTMLRMSISTLEKQKGVDFLNALVTVYNRDAIDEKNREAMDSKIFIDDRIALIDKELSAAEKKVENFKKDQGFTDLETDISMSVRKNSIYEDKLLQIETEINLTKYIEKYFNDPKNAGNLLPSNVIDDPTLVATINEYNKCLKDKDRFLRSNNENNPLIRKLNEQINALRIAISASLDNVMQGLNLARNDAEKQYQLYNNKIGNAPTLEREYSGMLRDQQIKASLFLMLLQKREETALQLAMTANSAKVVEDATSSGPISTNKQQIYMIAFLIGLIFPIGIILIIEIFHFTIRNSKEVKKISKLPVLGEIPVSETGNIAVRKNENKKSDEAFRIMRTNLLFTLGKDKKVILVTSTGPGEGKTFITINTAISMSLLDNKKVLMVGLDLRIPQLVKYLGVRSEHGISEYLSELETDLSKLIIPSGIVANLFVLPSGPIPPNPTELLSKDKLEEAFENLKNQFDYIFIDSAPTSTVSDTIVAARIANATIYVCRANVTLKSSMRNAIELSENKKIKNPSLVVNAVIESENTYGFRYGYGGEIIKSKKMFHFNK